VFSLEKTSSKGATIYLSLGLAVLKNRVIHACVVHNDLAFLYSFNEVFTYKVRVTCDQAFSLPTKIEIRGKTPADKSMF